MHTLVGIVGTLSFLVGVYFVIRLILAVIRGQPKGVYFKKLIAAIVIVCIAGIGDSATREPPSPEEIAAREAREVADKKAREETIAKLDGEYKELYDTKFNEYVKAGDSEDKAKNKALKDVEDKERKDKQAAEVAAKKEAEQKAEEEKKAAEQRAAEEKKLAEQKAAEEKKAAEQKTKADAAKEKLAALEKAGKIQYIDLGGGTYDVTITERATFKKYLGGSDNLNKAANYALQDEHERNIVSTANQCMELVQTVKDAGIKVNRFTVNLTGDVEDMEGYRSVDNVVICEIGGNKSFKRDDPYSFHNNTDRFWMINGL